MKKKALWSRDQKIGAIAATLALISIVVGLFVPEVRRKIGLEKPALVVKDVDAPVPKPQPPTDKPRPTSSPSKAKRSEQRPSASPPATVPPISQDCAPGASCAISNGQQGGITAGTINIGPPPPPPLNLTTKVSDQTGDATLGYQRVVTITVNISLSPVAIGIRCDNPVESISVGSRNGMVASNEHTFVEGNVAFIYYEGSPLTPRDELYVTLKSGKPFSVIEVRPATIKGLND